ncbi:hypothetical protein AMTRI_Chr05g63790 [Amborella trichopoda]
MALSSFIVIINNQVTVSTKASSLPCRVATTLRCLDFIPSQTQWIIFLYIRHLIILYPFTFLNVWTLPIIFHYLICLLVILLLIFVICVLMIVSVHVQYCVSFIGCYNVCIIIHISNCPSKEI